MPMPEGQMDGTAGGLAKFLDWAGAKGLMGARTASAYKSACKKVLEIDGEGWQNVDVRRLDIESQLRRFTRLQGARYMPESLQSYEARFRAATNAYLAYLEDPRGFKGVPVQRRRPSERETSAGPTPGKRAPDIGKLAVVGDASREGLINYPFPLRSGAMAYLQLPRDLDRSDVERLCAFIQSVALEPQGAFPVSEGFD